jgi:myosin heavy subunit
MSGRQVPGRGKGGTFKPVKGHGKGAGTGRPTNTGTKSGSPQQVPPKSQSNRFAALDKDDDAMECEEEEGEDPEVALKAERKAVVQQLESKLGKVRKAKKSLEEEDDLDAVQVLLDSHVQVERDLESKLLQARAHYQELKPAEVKLQQTQRDIEVTKKKLHATDDELQQVAELIAKYQARHTRLQEQKEQQTAKLSRLEAAAKVHHASMGGITAGGASAAQVTPEAASNVAQSADYIALQQQVNKLQGELKEALAALDVSRPAAHKRERADSSEGTTAAAAPAIKK